MVRTPAFHRLTGLRAAALVGVVAVAAIVPGAVAEAQFFPTEPTTVQLFDNFNSETVGAAPSGWTSFVTAGSGTPAFIVWDTWDDGVIDQLDAGTYWGRYIRDEASRSSFNTLLAANDSIPGSANYDPDEWTNLVMEWDMVPDRKRGSAGVAWAQLDTDADDVPDQGYYFYIEDVPNRDKAINEGLRAEWHLVRREGGIDTEIGTGLIEFDPTDNDLLTMYMNWGYRVRLEWFCGNLRVRAYRIRYTSDGGCTNGCLYGCGAGCDIASPENCWCDVVSWTDTTPLAAGMAGLYGRATGNADPDNMWNNVAISYWGTRCEAVCDSWSGFQEDWNNDGTADEASRDHLRFKFLYDAALLDYAMFTLDGSNIDNDVSAPEVVSCDGWKELVPLPGPLAASGANRDAMTAFLRPMASSVEWYDDGATTYWQRDFDNDPTSATYNPNPLTAVGGTPIAASLMDAYTDWYVANRSAGGAYELDPLADCRLWYVVLITDGEESCAATPDYVCSAGQAAELFANPAGGLEPVPVYVVGFSEGVSVSSPIECVASITGGQFYSASNASQLSGVLYDVFNQMEERDRSFIGFGVGQPAATAATVGSTATLLVYPWFVPRNGETIWDGSLFAFTTDEATPLSAIGFDDAHWNAKDVLDARLAEATPSRNIYWGSDPTDWDRVPIVGTVADGALATEFRALIDPGFTVSDTQLKEIENYITYIYDDGGLTPAPRPIRGPRRRPPEAPMSSATSTTRARWSCRLPTTLRIYDDYGFVPDGESGAHDYRLFVEKHAKRRRVVLAGANDGMLHAFDGGFFNRDTTNFPGEHDAGTGRELFAWVPRAVMPNVYNMVYAAEHQYMVDGHITTGDVWIDPDPDPSPSESDREWRTVALSNMRRGGRGIVALDITQPDPLSGQ
jgi:hypothetical protein